MEKVSSTQKSEDKIPELVLFKEFCAHTISVVDLIRKQEGVVLIIKLNDGKVTSATPDNPQKPCLLKEWLLGRSKASWFPIFESFYTQVVYYF